MVPRAGIETTYITDKQWLTAIVCGFQWHGVARIGLFDAQNLTGNGQEISKYAINIEDRFLVPLLFLIVFDRNLAGTGFQSVVALVNIGLGGG